MNKIKFIIEVFKKFKSRDIKIVFFEPLIQSAFVFMGTTAAIWLGYVIIYLFDQFQVSKPNIDIDNYKSIWPGIDLFFFNGSILIMTFSILASAAYTTSREMKINFFSVFPWLIIFFNALVYSIFIFEVNIDGLLDQNIFFKRYSNIVLWGSLIFMYFSFIREQWKNNVSEIMTKVRYENLGNSI